MSVDHIQKSLNGGEISDLVRGQIELEKYASGARRILNAMCLPHGPGKNRSGTKYISEAKYHYQRIRLVPFISSIDDAYVLESGNRYMRVFKNSARIETQELIRNGSIEEDAYWIESSSPTSVERSDEKAAIGSYSLKIVTSSAGSGALNYVHGIVLSIGETLSASLSVYPNVTSVRIRVRYQPYQSALIDIYDTDHTVISNQWNKIEFTTSALTAPGEQLLFYVLSTTTDPAATHYIDAVSVERNAVCEISTDFNSLGLFDYAQSIDELFYAHANYFPKTIVRYADNAWFYEDIDYLNSVSDSNYSWTLSGAGTNEYYVRTSGNQDPVLNKPLWLFKSTTALQEGTLGSLAAGQWGYGDNDSLGYKTIYYRDSAGVDPDTLGSTTLQMGTYPTEWNEINGYPNTVVVHNDRLDWASKENLFFSAFGLYKDHTESDTVTDGDGLNLRLGDGQFSQILFLRALAGALVALSPNNEWIMSGSDGTSAITATSKRAKVASSSGSESIRPITLNNSIIHALRHGKALKELIYDYNSDSFIGYELSDFAEHLTRNYAIKDMVFQKTPFKTLWAAREDGTLLGLTYYPQQRVFGWHRHSIGGSGKVDAVCSVPGSGYDELYMIVTRQWEGEKECAELATYPAGPNGVWYDGTYIYASLGSQGIAAYKFDGEYFIEINKLNDILDHQAVWGDGTYIYAAGFGHGIAAYKFDGTTFTTIASIDNGGNYMNVWGDGTYIYIANSWTGVRAYSFNGTSFTLLDTQLDGSGSYQAVWGDGTYIYTACGDDGLRAYTFNGSTFTLVATVDDGGSYQGVWGDGAYIFAACDTAGLRAYTFNGSSFTAAGFVSGSSECNDVWGDGTYIYSTWESDGLKTYTHNGSAFTLLNNSAENIEMKDVWGGSDYIFTAANYSGVMAFKISDKQRKYIEVLQHPFIKPDHGQDYFMDDDTTGAVFMDSAVTVDNRQNIENMTNANPCVVTITGHGLSNSDTVKIRNVTGFLNGTSSGVNGLDFTVANKTDDTFELSGLDSSGFSAYKSGGTAAKKVTSISGLDHLEGLEVVALGDGKKNGTTYTVSGGAITLSSAASVVHVGLAYDSEIETLPPIIDTKQGSFVDEKKRISSVSLKVFETDGISVGPDKDNLVTVPFDTESVPTGNADRLYDGVTKSIPINGTYEKEPTILIKQSNHLPMTVSAIIKQIEV